MKKQINYYVIGEKYYYECYGGTPTLIGAKRLANKNRYYHLWEWHIPEIYRAEDTYVYTDEDGNEERIPIDGAIAVAFAWCEDGKVGWEGEEGMKDYNVSRW